jgi:hypothetical protein
MHPPAGSPIEIYRVYAWINVKPRHMACATDLYHVKQVQDHEDDRNNDQSVNPTSGFREAWTDVPTEIAEQPQDYQYYDDDPK